MTTCSTTSTAPAAAFADNRLSTILSSRASNRCTQFAKRRPRSDDIFVNATVLEYTAHCQYRGTLGAVSRKRMTSLQRARSKVNCGVINRRLNSTSSGRCRITLRYAFDRSASIRYATSSFGWHLRCAQTAECYVRLRHSRS